MSISKPRVSWTGAILASEARQKNLSQQAQQNTTGVIAHATLYGIIYRKSFRQRRSSFKEQFQGVDFRYAQ
ncbi:hypothetical protein HF325_005551 [Metschnikowia pulcherrima]|uniref:Uncharacterized protein n=1 Tax=Metschnikowia pulcherrima TaxID=27326 RepID=A0A8H7GMJ4_9ASCO|nr:hypothetical protein HF325_005551 [Metschnikowia pulcherrima]